jgi:excinuclease UvrABC ATPase subunit
MNTTALLVSDDLILRSEIRPVLTDAGIGCECCGIAGSDHVISRGKFECILLDIPDPVKFSDVMTKLRAEKFNRYAIVLALVDDEHRIALAKTSGVNFFVSKSVRLAADFRQALNSAHALMIHEKRRYYRHPIDIVVDVICDGQPQRVKMIDLSARGACLGCDGLPTSKTLRLEFVLPGTNRRLEVDAITAWSKGTNIGVEFNALTSDSDKALKAWLREKEGESQLFPATNRGADFERKAPQTAFVRN